MLTAQEKCSSWNVPDENGDTSILAALKTTMIKWSGFSSTVRESTRKPEIKRVLATQFLSRDRTMDIRCCWVSFLTMSLTRPRKSFMMIEDDM